jgi:hypothetical protein
MGHSLASTSPVEAPIHTGGITGGYTATLEIWGSLIANRTSHTIPNERQPEPEPAMKQLSDFLAATISILFVLVSGCGVRNSQGSKTFPNGAKCVGELRWGRPNGPGILTLSNGTTVAGEFENDKMNGQGTITWPDGSTYVGQFQNNLPNGQGTLTTTNGSKYVGTFRDGIPNGQVSLTLPAWTNDIGLFLGSVKPYGTNVVIRPNPLRSE